MMPIRTRRHKIAISAFDQKRHEKSRRSIVGNATPDQLIPDLWLTKEKDRKLLEDVAHDATDILRIRRIKLKFGLYVNRGRDVSVKHVEEDYLLNMFPIATWQRGLVYPTVLKVEDMRFPKAELSSLRFWNS